MTATTTDRRTVQDLAPELTDAEKDALCIAINEAPEAGVVADHSSLPHFTATWARTCAETALEVLQDFSELDASERNLVSLLTSTLAKLTVPTKTLEERIADAAKDGEEALWATVARAFPEAKTGDMDPFEVIRLSERIREAITSWVAENVPGADAVVEA